MIKFKNDLQNQLDEQMQEGYILSLSGDSKEAAKVWMGLWQKIIDTMNEFHIECIEDMDEAFSDLQSIYNWAMDFEMVLSNASGEDRNFIQSKIEFCTEYIAKSRDKNEYNVLVMKRTIAAAYFEIGKKDEGEQLFKKYLEEHPTSGWGWISWSDQYGIFGDKKIKKFEKAINILKQGLEVEDLKDPIDVLERLDELYTELGMMEESLEVKHKIAEQKGRSNVREWQETLQLLSEIKPVNTIKVGRNDPCPCGSGKKHKKCCG